MDNLCEAVEKVPCRSTNRVQEMCISLLIKTHFQHPMNNTEDSGGFKALERIVNANLQD